MNRQENETGGHNSWFQGLTLPPTVTLSSEHHVPCFPHLQIVENTVDDGVAAQWHK